jgi:hypothetical protein
MGSKQLRRVHALWVLTLVARFSREGSQIDCVGLFQAAQGTGALDLADVGEEGRGTGVIARWNARSLTPIPKATLIGYSNHRTAVVEEGATV